MLSRMEAEKELRSAVQMNPGPWEQHSIAVAGNARLIAARVNGMDCDKAYVLRLLPNVLENSAVSLV